MNRRDFLSLSTTAPFAWLAQLPQFNGSYRCKSTTYDGWLALHRDPLERFRDREPARQLDAEAIEQGGL